MFPIPPHATRDVLVFLAFASGLNDAQIKQFLLHSEESTTMKDCYSSLKDQWILTKDDPAVTEWVKDITIQEVKSISVKTEEQANAIISAENVECALKHVSLWTSNFNFMCELFQEEMEHMFKVITGRENKDNYELKFILWDLFGSVLVTHLMVACTPFNSIEHLTECLTMVKQYEYVMTDIPAFNKNLIK